MRRPSTSTKRSVRSASGRGAVASWAIDGEGKDEERGPMPVMDLQALLRGIDASVGEGERGLGLGVGGGRPPY